jgi:hypothetical protein
LPSATIEIIVDYEPPTPPPNPAPPRPATATDSIDTGTKSSLSGSGDISGASTSKTVPVQGGTDQTDKKTPVPTGGKFTKATVKAKLDCPGGPKTGELSGNVSVSGRVEGNCIVITAVDRVTADGTETTITKTRNICCDGQVLLAEFDEKSLVAQRGWMGLSLAAGENGAIVRKVLPRSPAEKAKLRTGDIIQRIGKHAVSGPGAVRTLLAEIRTRAKVNLAIKRGSRNVTLGISLERVRLVGVDFGGEPVEDMKCDSNCECAVKAEGFICTHLWRYVGEGPNGGALLREICVSVDPDDEDPDTSIRITRCGFGEFF